jgi:N-acetylneuraminate epimerase
VKVIIALLFTIYIMLFSLKDIAQNNTEHITWSHPAQLPAINGNKQLGLAGVFTGVNDGVLLVAGGSNFADGAKPWQGGKKIHYDDVYVLEKHGENKFTWITPKTKHLGNKTAYGASTSIAAGIVCAGGETETSDCSSEVFLMKWNKKQQDVSFQNLPSLPVPLVNACMTSIGNVIYLFGGESKGIPSDKCFKLNLDVAIKQWEDLPSMPIAMSHSVAVTQSNGKYPCIYIIGGRSSTPAGISTLHNNAFCYDPERNKWFKLAPVGNGDTATTISAATGVPEGNHEIILIGGDKGNIFHQIEVFNNRISHARNDDEKKQLQNEKMQLLNHHKGFSRDVYIYNTLKNTWEQSGSLPFYGQVTTTAVKWGDKIFIPCGEIKPGTRTAAITMGEFYSAK